MIGNLDSKHHQKKIKIKVTGLKKKQTLNVIHGSANYKTKKNILYTDLGPNEIKVLRVEDFSL